MSLRNLAGTLSFQLHTMLIWIYSEVWHTLLVLAQLSTSLQRLLLYSQMKSSEEMEKNKREKEFVIAEEMTRFPWYPHF